METVLKGRVQTISSLGLRRESFFDIYFLPFEKRLFVVGLVKTFNPRSSLVKNGNPIIPSINWYLTVKGKT